MACPAIRLEGVTEEVWTCLRNRAASMGINLPQGDAGTMNHPEGDADYTWHQATGTLIVTFTRTPSWISCGDVEARVRLAVASCGGG